MVVAFLSRLKVSWAGNTNWRGKNQYDWPPSTNLFWSSAFYIENITYILNKKSYLNEEVNGTEPSFQLVIPDWVIYLMNLSDFALLFVG